MPKNASSSIIRLLSYLPPPRTGASFPSIWSSNRTPAYKRTDASGSSNLYLNNPSFIAGVRRIGTNRLRCPGSRPVAPNDLLGLRLNGSGPIMTVRRTSVLPSYLRRAVTGLDRLLRGSGRLKPTRSTPVRQPHAPLIESSIEGLLALPRAPSSERHLRGVLLAVGARDRQPICVLTRVE